MLKIFRHIVRRLQYQKFFKKHLTRSCHHSLNSRQRRLNSYIMIFNKYRNFTNCVVIHTQSVHKVNRNFTAFSVMSVKMNYTVLVRTRTTRLANIVHKCRPSQYQIIRRTLNGVHNMFTDIINMVLVSLRFTETSFKFRHHILQ